ncbi:MULTISPECIES: FAD-dependent oxidoreductase [unclassified Lentimonas]|uniref:FAD-dependent oxidoreductase n=1 Tax=unclassified Lentimonas TaxID=2630993 RepID=UPI001321C646|nr:MULTISPECIES: FAD-dependent oxidoreductase [unclassified Lentimonas]CAA6692485.1 FIG00554817: hypothetical protein [Lentimonas sp. CC19]CAA6693438.1 FIG00554817: hypothetical protein [Lentimonas sp. CC10]CAA7070767.1 FIG00554817: hypothetical protein [Lentimonas sp. CC11]
MIIEKPSSGRALKEIQYDVDFVVVGGGLAGTCAAISAAREGLKVVLVQDRPILGGNASSEVRLWALGATSHLGNNNRWSREGGLVNEILEENLYRNRQGNPLIFDTILLEKCHEVSNLTLLLNTAAYEVEKSDPDTISAVIAFCAQNSTRYVLKAPRFCDASGDGIVGFMAGAAFRMGAETKEEFGEGFAPDESYGELLGHSIYFYSKDVGEPVKYKAPSWALREIKEIPRYRQIKTNMQGCNFWWFEYGGRMDTVHQTEDIKWELWKVVYGVWDYIKNSGEFPEAENLTLEWVGHIPGKRESRRFEGDVMIKQQDVVEQTYFEDCISHGGWALDLHPADGVYSDKSGCTQWHSKGVYSLPLRAHYSRNINNLFLAGRIISATHVAFGSTRVMLTCAAGGVGVGTAAAVCQAHDCSPRDVSCGEELRELQTRLDRAGQYLPGIKISDTKDLTAQAILSASSTLELSRLEGGENWKRLDFATAMLLPLAAGECPTFSFELDASEATTLEFALMRSSDAKHFTPDVCLAEQSIELVAGVQAVSLTFPVSIDRAGYQFIKLEQNAKVSVRESEQRLTGVLSVFAEYNIKVATSSVQNPPEGIGIDRFEFWLPQRRPEGRNLAMTVEPALQAFDVYQVASGFARPTDAVNAWVADFDDAEPTLSADWEQPVQVARVVLEFDPDWDHPMESVLMTHPEEVVPFTVRDFDLLDADGKLLAEVRDHHGARYDLCLSEAITTSGLRLKMYATHGALASVFRMRVF